MTRLVVTSDVHGSYSTWLTLKDILTPEDSLAVAGDLFGTRYPIYGHADYQPERILEELKDFPNQFYFVYGNCDRASFSPGYENHLKFDFMEWKIFLHHGDRYFKQLPQDIIFPDVNLVIQGHTHVFALKNITYDISSDGEPHNSFHNCQKQMILLNPGSLASPRTHFYTYAVVDNNVIDIIDIKTAASLKSISVTKTISKQS
ncbi:MAG: metallophosphoesterase family protein [Desulfamplus sp.]|nr:metallophosphoesterase family protein [Desulfamplus sp.]MBF0411156.1 metallophosphoesterase family protein [Desulfamplus sp.]